MPTTPIDSTAWPLDAFSRLVLAASAPTTVAQPAAHSYADDANMRALDLLTPAQPEDSSDLARDTAAVGLRPHPAAEVA